MKTQIFNILIYTVNIHARIILHKINQEIYMKNWCAKTRSPFFVTLIIITIIIIFIIITTLKPW